MLLGLAALAIIAIVLVIILIISLLTPGPNLPGPRPTQPPSSSTPGRPTAQPADCPDVQTIVIPGTWESSATDDPENPHANPNSLLLKVSKPLADAYPSSRTDVWTVPYVAQFRNPTNLGDRQVNYDVSRAQGYDRARAKIVDVHQRCGLTSFVLLGFSQGAVIAGDLATQIGNDRGVVPADQVIGVGLIADGRREPGQAQSVGPDPKGVGAEVALGAFGGIVGGTTMTGSRPGGFGDLKDRTYSLCAPGDLICDSPTIANPIEGLSKIAGALNNPIHAMYNTTRYWNDDGQSAVRWMSGWVTGVVKDAPKPPHN